MKEICDRFGLLREGPDRIVRVPFLVKGEILAPPDVGRDRIDEAFQALGEDATCARLDNAQVLREPVIDRESMKRTGEYFYQVLPLPVASDLIEPDLDMLMQGLYALPFSEVLSYLQALVDALDRNRELVHQVRTLSGQTAEHPDPYHDAAFAALPLLLDPELARATVDAELAAWGRPGSEFLDGWVETPAHIFPGMASLMGRELFREETPRGLPVAKAQIRAMPTRQLHITAGNAPAVPIISLLRAILTKSAAVIKSPYGATLPAALVALAAASAAADHPLTRNLSIVYWPGGDESTENALFMPNAFDRIVVWGAPDAVASVRSRARFTRAVCFNPRYGFSFIGREAFQENLEEAAVLASFDTMIWNQKACIASQVHYVEGEQQQAEQYAGILREVLARWDGYAGNHVPPATRGMIKRMRRGKYMNASWHLNMNEGDFLSGVVVMPDAFDILDHPMSRLVVVRPVNDLRAAFPYLHHAVSSVGVYPEHRRLELRDAILARGVTNVLPLGQVERMFGGMPHDGMMVLNELVDWKNG